MDDVGLKVWDANGDPVITVDDQVGTVLGIVETGTTNGSVTGVTAFANGDPWYQLVSKDGESNREFPAVTISGTTISWTFDGDWNPGEQDCFLMYGVY